MSALAVTRVTHSCHLIEIGGLMILTDPWFSEKTAYHPGERVAFGVEDLPHLDAILITHAHYDHCDLDALDAYSDRDVPLIVCRTVVQSAREHGFTDVRELSEWESTTVGEVRVTAAPAAHLVPEITFVIEGGGRGVYFAGDSLLVPGMKELPRRFGRIDLALVPTNGLRIRPMANRKVVMDFADAARLVALLKPSLAIPHHYAFTSGRLGDRVLTKGDRDPERFVDAVARLAPEVKVRVTRPGERTEVG